VKIFNVALGMLLMLLGTVASDSALAGRGHSGRPGHFGHSGRFAHPGHISRPVRIGALFAVPLIAPWYTPPSGYFPVPPSVAPQVHIEQEPAVPLSKPQANYWYYCAEAKAYYPYVDACPGGWQQVVPEAPAPY
jgi:hypothetical protein